MKLRTHRGTLIEVAPTAIGSGGEADVYELVGAADRVAKIYKKPPNSKKVRKLQWMSRNAQQSLLAIASWPIDVLYEPDGKKCVGVLLPRCDGVEIHNVYGPVSRREKFPEADYRFLVHVARNCAAAFESLHHSDVVIGDVNQGNLLVNKRGLIRFIDCDSFQICTGQELHLCGVGVSHFQSPEMQQVSFANTKRSKNDDCFGLAVLVFHLLFLGRHPYVGRWKGGKDLSIEEAIQNRVFFYSERFRNSRATPPPQVLALSSVDGLAELFERAFCLCDHKATPRPTAKEWRVALDLFSLTLKRCNVDHHHFFSRTSSQCPWCEIEQGGGPDYFLNQTKSNVTGTDQEFDIERSWRVINAISPPRVQYTKDLAFHQSYHPSLPKGDLAILRLSRLFNRFSLLGLLFLLLAPIYLDAIVVALIWSSIFAVVAFALRNGSSVKKRLTELNLKIENLHQQSEVNRIRANEKQKQLSHRFSQVSLKLKSTYSSFRSLHEREEAEIAGRLKNGTRYQELVFLDTYSLRDAVIRGLGEGRIAKLNAYGIYTAKDAEYWRIVQVPGFGASMASLISVWRMDLLKRFRSHSDNNNSKVDLSDIHRKYHKRRIYSQSVLSKGQRELYKISQQAKQFSQDLHTDQRRVLTALKLATLERDKYESVWRKC